MTTTARRTVPAPLAMAGSLKAAPGLLRVPRSVGVPPSLTIMALARRVATVVAERLTV